MSIRTSFYAAIAGASLLSPLSMPSTAQAQGNVPTLGKEKLDPKIEQQIHEARKIIAEMRAKGASQEEIEQETLRLSKEIVGEDKGLMGRLDLAICIALILGLCLIAGRLIEKRDRERAKQREVNPDQPPEKA